MSSGRHSASPVRLYAKSHVPVIRAARDLCVGSCMTKPIALSAVRRKWEFCAARRFLAPAAWIEHATPKVTGLGALPLSYAGRRGSGGDRTHARLGHWPRCSTSELPIHGPDWRTRTSCCATGASSRSPVRRAGKIQGGLPPSRPSSGSAESTRFAGARSASGTRPMAQSAPSHGASGSRMATCGTPASWRRRSTAASADSSGTERTTALVPWSRAPGLDSPAA